MYLLLGVLVLALVILLVAVLRNSTISGKRVRASPSSALLDEGNVPRTEARRPRSSGEPRREARQGGAGPQRSAYRRPSKPAEDQDIEYRAHAGPRTGSEERWDPYAQDQSRVHRVRAARHRPSTLPDYYKLLGLERGATDPQIERAYRRCAARVHPDRFHGDPEGRAAAEAQLKELNHAMQILRDPTRRARYDALL